jgi:ABC-type Fe3+ transport system, periplasmic component
LLTTDVARLHRAQSLQLLQPVHSNVLVDAIPEHYRQRDGYWYGLSLRSRVMVYSKKRVTPGQLSTYEALANPAWKGRICVRSSSNPYNQSLVSSMIVHNGLAAVEQWATGLVANFARPPRGGDRDLIKAVAAGECDLALVNTYYLGGMLHSAVSGEREAAEKVALFWPNQMDRRRAFQHQRRRGDPFRPSPGRGDPPD